MLEVRRRFDLCQESFGTDYRREFGLQHLQRHYALVLDVLGQVDSRHPALTKLTLYAVAALQGCVQAGDGFAHALKMRRRSANREILQQHQRRPQREERAHSDHAHEAHRAEGLILKVMRVASPARTERAPNAAGTLGA